MFASKILKQSGAVDPQCLELPDKGQRAKKERTQREEDK